MNQLSLFCLTLLAGTSFLLISIHWSQSGVTSVWKENVDLCQKYHWKWNPDGKSPGSLPIYDWMIFSSEFDILEIRLYELYDYVTLFFIVESSLTLTGQPKPLYLKENWSRFARYHSKMRRIEVVLIPNITDPWENEHRMRREGLRLAMANISSSSPYLLLSSDVDEIPKAEFMSSLTHCPLPNSFFSFVLLCDFYYYSFEFQNAGDPWPGPILIYVDRNSSKFIAGDTLRRDRANLTSIPGSCYHCTWCFNQLAEVRFKISAYSHTEHNQRQFRTQEHILDRYRHGQDLFDRSDQIYLRRENNPDLPQLLRAQPNRFMYMIQRSNLANLGFIDA